MGCLRFFFFFVGWFWEAFIARWRLALVLALVLAFSWRRSGVSVHGMHVWVPRLERYAGEFYRIRIICN